MIDSCISYAIQKNICNCFYCKKSSSNFKTLKLNFSSLLSFNHIIKMCLTRLRYYLLLINQFYDSENNV